MLTELCRELRNWFDKDRLFGEFTITNGEIDLTDAGIADGQHFRIVGSVFNDGVYTYPTTELTDEVFDGAVWLMAVPQEVIDLSDMIDAWRGKYEGIDSANMSPFTSESLGVYSYSKGASNSGANGGNGNTWQAVFGSSLNKWRKIR